MHLPTRLALGLAAMLGTVEPLAGQTLRQVVLDLGRGEISRRYLPARDSFALVVRVAGEARELRGQYTPVGDAGAARDLVSWPRAGATRSRDATLLVGGLEPGRRYRFEFTLIRRPTGNEGRLVEAGVTAALQRSARLEPTASLDGLAQATAAPVRAALIAVLPSATPRAGSPFTGEAPDLAAALAARGLDRLQEDFQFRDSVARALRIEFTAAAGALAGSPEFAATIADIGRRLTEAGGLAELAGPLGACRRLQAAPAAAALPLDQDLDIERTLAVLKEYDARVGSCRGLLRDVRLPRYVAVRAPGAQAAGDLLLPLESRLEACRHSAEQLLTAWRRRDGTLRQVAGDLRRSLDSGVTMDSTVVAVFAAEPARVMPLSSTLGFGLAGAWVPCSSTGECVRVVPQMTAAFRLRSVFGVEAGLTLAGTESAGRSRHLFWFSSGMVGATVRLGPATRQRLGAGLLILRNETGDGLDVFHLGGYVSFTLFDIGL